MYVSVKMIENYHKDMKNRKLNTSGADERELEEALQRSLKDMKDKDQFDTGNNQGDDEGAPSVGTILNAKAGGGKGQEEAKKFQAFKGQGVTLQDAQLSSGGDVNMRDEDAALYSAYGDDPELAFAIKMSMMEEEAKRLQVPDEPPEGPGAVNLQLRLPDGTKLQRRFHAEVDTL